MTQSFSTTRNTYHVAVALFTAILCAFCALPAAAADAPPQGQVNINSADASQLAKLPRVGPALAGKILAHREENGEFKKVEDLLMVRGIGEKTFELMRAFVKTSGDTTLSQKLKVSEIQAAQSAGDQEDGQDDA